MAIAVSGMSLVPFSEGLPAFPVSELTRPHGSAQQGSDKCLQEAPAFVLPAPGQGDSQDLNRICWGCNLLLFPLS